MGKIYRGDILILYIYYITVENPNKWHDKLSKCQDIHYQYLNEIHVGYTTRSLSKRFSQHRSESRNVLCHKISNLNCIILSKIGVSGTLNFMKTILVLILKKFSKERSR